MNSAFGRVDSVFVTINMQHQRTRLSCILIASLSLDKNSTILWLGEWALPLIVQSDVFRFSQSGKRCISYATMNE